MNHCVKVSTPRGRVVEHHEFDVQSAAFECKDRLVDQYEAEGYTVEYYNASVFGNLNRNTKRKAN